jgi:hypothetical protein
MPGNVNVGAIPRFWPTPRPMGNDALPQLLALGWSGTFVTSTNVASVEVRTNLFSIDVPRTRIGRFAFSLDILDVPPTFLRGYRLRVIARNSAGLQSEEDVPLSIH